MRSPVRAEAILLLLLVGCRNEERLGAFVLEQRTTPLEDYSHVGASVAPYRVVSPARPSEVAGIVLEANRLGTRLRVRGRGHSMNQSSLPRSGEVCLSTSRLDYYEFDEPGTVRVAAGVPIYDVERLLRSMRMSLPVLNDGGRGPSVGGYVAAGGIGRGAAEHGGFWANVLELTVVTGAGELRVVKRADPLFPWLFGSMGRLAIVVEAKLRVQADSSDHYPLGKAGRLEVEPGSSRVETDENLFWLTIFAPITDEDRLRRELEAIMRGHGEQVTFTEIYQYRFAGSDVVAPLVYPHSGDFLAMGIWGNVRAGNPRADTLYSLSADVDKVLRLDEKWRRYAQTEVVHPEFDYTEYFGPSIASQLGAFKSSLDPRGVLNAAGGDGPPVPNPRVDNR